MCEKRSKYNYYSIANYSLQCFPMAFIVELAGGAASDGHQPMLDVVPTGLHVRSPIYLGTKSDVEEVTQMIANNPPHSTN